MRSFSLEDLKKFHLQTPIAIRYADLDTLHHVNNAVYLMYLEEARLHYAKQVLEWNGDLNQIDMVLANVHVEYLLPIFLHSPLVIHTRVSKLGNKSFEIEYLFVIEEVERKIATYASTTLVYFDLKSQKSIPIPQDVRKKILTFEGDNLTLS